MTILFIYGPPCCGKTTNAKRFKEYYKADFVYEESVFKDDTAKQLNNVIVLCQERPADIVLKTLRAKTISFADAMLEIAK